MATPKRWAVREAANVTFFRLDDKAGVYAKGDPVVTLNTLKMTDVETTGETTYAQGGRGNAKLVGFSSNREARVTMQDAIFDNAALAMLTGNDIITGIATVSLYEDLIADEGGIITIESSLSLATPSNLRVYPLDGNSIGALMEVTTDYSATDKVITVTGAAAGDRFRVYFDAVTAADAQTVKVTADKFGGTFKVVADVLVRDEDTQQDFYGQFIAYKAKIEDNFTFSFSPDGDPSVLDIPLEILKSSESTNMWEFVIYGETE
jgi:hypothetical protein